MVLKNKVENFIRKSKGLVPQPDLLLLLIATPLLLTIVFVVTPVLHRSMSGAISVEVNMERMYDPLKSENTLTSLLNSEFEGERMSKMLKYHIHYGGDFSINGSMVNETLEEYLDVLVPSGNYLLLLNSTDFEENISGSSMEDLKREDSHLSRAVFRTPDMDRAGVELRLKKR